MNDMGEKCYLCWVLAGAKPPVGGAWMLTQGTVGVSRAKVGLHRSSGKGRSTQGRKVGDRGQSHLLAGEVECG